MKKITTYLLLIINIQAFSQINISPFVARITIQGERDNTFNTPGYNIILNNIKDKDVQCVSLNVSNLNEIYLIAQAQQPSAGTMTYPGFPSIFKLLDNGKLNTRFNSTGFTILTPNVQCFNDYEIFESECGTINGGVILAGNAKYNSKIYPFSLKLNLNGYLDNYYREGGIYFLIDSKDQRFKAIKNIQNKLYLVKEMYSNSIISNQLLCTKQNGLIDAVSIDTLYSVCNPKILNIENSIFILATKQDKNSDDFPYKGIVLSKYNLNCSIDKSFGKNGVIALQLSSGQFIPMSIKNIKDKIFVSGKIGDQSIAIVSFNLDGSLNESFAGDGILIKNVVGSNLYFGDMVLNESGIFICGSSDKSWFIFATDFNGEPLNWFGERGMMNYYELYNSNGAPYDVNNIVFIRPITMIFYDNNKKIMIAGNSKLNK
jgi:hypothetical protein